MGITVDKPAFFKTYFWPFIAGEWNQPCSFAFPVRNTGKEKADTSHDRRLS
jgi:hypothetical protein